MWAPGVPAELGISELVFTLLAQAATNRQKTMQGLGNFNGVRQFGLVPVATIHEGLRHPSV
jgi:hypothetical protein